MFARKQHLQTNQIHTSKKANTKKKELYMSQFNLHHPTEGTLELDQNILIFGHREGSALSKVKSRDPSIKDPFRS